MNHFQLAALQSAIAPVTESVSATMHGNARVCTEMRAQNSEKGETKPTAVAKQGLAPRQLMGARLLVSGKSIAATARELGVNPCTIRRWKTNPRFAAEIQRLIDSSKLAKLQRPAPAHRDRPENDKPLSPRIQAFYDRVLAERNARKCALLHGNARVESSK